MSAARSQPLGSLASRMSAPSRNWVATVVDIDRVAAVRTGIYAALRELHGRAGVDHVRRVLEAALEAARDMERPLDAPRERSPSGVYPCAHR